jgi:hypothetical protein
MVGERSEGIRASIHKSHEYKMKVMLKPHLWVNHNFYTGDLDFSTEKRIWKKPIMKKYMILQN